MLQKLHSALPLLLSVSLVACDSDSSSSKPQNDGGSSPPPAATCSGKSGQLGSFNLTMADAAPDGGVREALVRIPTSYDPTKPTPLVLNIHGLLEGAVLHEGVTHMTPAAEERGWILVYPQGLAGLIGVSWNAGDCCGNSFDDVTFLRELVKKLEEDYCIDPKRVFATGLSNGAMMSYRLACEAADVFAAVAPVAGAVQVDPCTPSRPVPILAIHGTGDTIVPYNGGLDGLVKLLKFPPVSYSTDVWRRNDGCAGAPPADPSEKNEQPGNSTAEGGAIPSLFEGAKNVFEKGDSACYTWSECNKGTEVELCTVVNGGHGWPGGEPLVGKSSKDLIATDAILDFFEKHPMP